MRYNYPVMTKHEVVIAGGGPTGLMLAGELALARVDVAIVERRASNDLEGLRAGGLHMRTLEVLDQRGIADRFISQGQPHRIMPFARGTLDVSDSPTRHNYFLGLWQIYIERTLADWVAELKVPVYRGTEVTGFVQDDTGVNIELSASREPPSPSGDLAASSDGSSLRAKYLVGCDGGRSVVRKQAGIDFPGWDPSTSYLIGEVEFAEEPEWGIRRGEKGMAAIGKVEDGNRVRVVINEKEIRQGEQPTLDDVREALVAAYGTDFGLRSAGYLSRFTDMARQAASYWKGRVLLAGDAAHVHSPMGGQGLNLGVQDAVNLGWKLAQVVHGTSPESLLETYHAERHPVGARVLRNTMALTALERGDDRNDALREMISELFKMDETRRQYVAMMSGLDIRYDLGHSESESDSDIAKRHPLLGRRMPDLDLVTADGLQQVFNLLHDARPVLLNLGERSELSDLMTLEIAPWADRVQLIDARYDGVWELPVLGAVTAPSAVLIRPDGYVAWVGDGADEGLRDALTTWFGPRNHGN
jgi:2-polyprenyl-6-methoxyphenol hydroxylase-like FAD-dependent oxidoreductase